jgi:ATP-dependent Clp protease ATP-binding subunit ClpB
VNLQLEGVRKHLSEKNITIEFSNDLREWIAKMGFEPSYGARPLKRTIQKYLVNRLSEKILGGEVAEGDRVIVSVDDRGIVEFTSTHHGGEKT